MIGRHIQALENRRMLSAVMSGTTLLVQGSASADTINVSMESGKIKTVIGSETASFSPSIIRKILILGGNGDDAITVKGFIKKRILIEAGAGNDTVTGSKGADLIRGGDGADLISGNAGNDTLHGDAGDDTLYGDAGNDTVTGDAGADILAGDDENALAFSGESIANVVGNDYLSGGDGDDWLLCGTSNARLKDNCGKDTLEGGAGADILDARGLSKIIDKTQSDYVPKTDSPSAESSVAGAIRLTIRIKNSRGTLNFVKVPGGIGYFSKNTPVWISSNPNASDGVLVLKKSETPWTLKDIFKTWGVSIGTNHVGRFRATSSNALTVKVNGSVIANFMTYELPLTSPATEVVVQIG